MEEKAMKNMLVFVFTGRPDGITIFPAVKNEKRRNKMFNRYRKRKYYEYL